jgi:hypothetical protein
MRRKPLSSRNSRWAPSPCAFFYMRPLVALPMSNGLWVPLDRLALGYLARPFCTSQHSPHVIGMVYNTEFLVDHGLDSLQRPQVVRKAVGQSSFQKKSQESPAFVLSQFPRATRNRFGLQTGWSLPHCRLLPSKNRRKRGANALRDFLQTQAAIEQCHRSLSAALQCLRRSCGSHPSYIGTLIALLLRNAIRHRKRPPAPPEQVYLLYRPLSCRK